MFFIWTDTIIYIFLLCSIWIYFKIKKKSILILTFLHPTHRFIITLRKRIIHLPLLEVKIWSFVLGMFINRNTSCWRSCGEKKANHYHGSALCSWTTGNKSSPLWKRYLGSGSHLTLRHYTWAWDQTPSRDIQANICSISY